MVTNRLVTRISPEDVLCELMDRAYQARMSNLMFNYDMALSS